MEMKTAPVFRGKRIDNGEFIDGFYYSIAGYSYITSGTVITGTKAAFYSTKVDQSTVDQIGGDLFEENKRLNELVAMKSGTIELWKEENGSLKAKLADSKANHRALAESANHGTLQSAVAPALAVLPGCEAVRRIPAARRAVQATGPTLPTRPASAQTLCGMHRMH